VLLACDLVGFSLCVGWIAHSSSLLVQALFSGVAVIFAARLFMLGHDACHQALTPNRKVNRAFGTIAFLATLHPYSLWDLGHNRIHHRYTNLRRLDYVWEPLDPAEYASLSAFAKWRYRFFRTPLGHFAYYPAEIWWKKMYFPRSREIGGYTAEYVWDHVLVGAWTIVAPILLVLLRLHWFGPHAPLAGLASTLVFGWVVPILGFNLGMSTVIYLHHTHADVEWTTAETATTDGQIAGAVHIVLPGFLERTLHHIMEHTAHHARPGIPLYHLSTGQQVLEARHESVIVERWTLKFHLDTLRHCKLFDLKRRCWVNFDAPASPEA
jgi:omega-6 fatty acid desaturase (delta-12 desaturase)